MKSARNRQIKNTRRVVYAKCRDGKHLWIVSKWQDNMRICKCCGAIDFK